MSQDKKDNAAREAGFVAKADQRLARAPRVDDPAFMPKVQPSEMTRILMRSLGDRLSLDALTHARTMIGALEHAIVEAREGRFEGLMFCLMDLEAAQNAVNGSINDCVAAVYDSISKLDPAYGKELSAVRREQDIRRAVDRGRHLSALQLEFSRGLAAPGSVELEAITRLLKEKKGSI